MDRFLGRSSESYARLSGYFQDSCGLIGRSLSTINAVICMILLTVMLHGGPEILLKEGMDLTGVSVLYGPGPYISWYCLSWFVIAQKSFGGWEYTHTTLPSFALWTASDNPATTRDTIDLDWIVFLMYPIIASVDILWKAKSSVHPDGPTMAAPGHVTAAATFFTSLYAMQTCDRNDHHAPRQNLVVCAVWMLSMISLIVDITQMPDYFTLVSVATAVCAALLFVILDVRSGFPTSDSGRAVRFAVALFRDLVVFLLVSPAAFIPQSYMDVRSLWHLSVIGVTAIFLLAKYLL